MQLENFSYSKGKGQNFLIDKNVLNKMKFYFDKLSLQTVVEIGPGSGNFTDAIYSDKTDFILIEYDSKLVEFLKEKYRSFQNLLIIEYDATQFNFVDRFTTEISVVGNLPYSVARNIFFNICQNSSVIENGLFLIQKDAADKLFLTSKEGSYSVLRFFINHYYKLEYLFNVSPNSFRPRPKINSTYFSINKHKKKNFFEPSCFLDFLKKLFKSQRKTVRNNLKIINNIAKIDENILKKRPLQLSLEQIEEIYIILNNLEK